MRTTRSRAGTWSSISLTVSPITCSLPPQQGQGSPWQNGYVERLIGALRRECIRADLRRGACAENSDFVHILLLSIANAFIAAQGRSDWSSGPAIWNRCCHTCSGRTASSLRADMIFGKDRTTYRFFMPVFSITSDHLITSSLMSLRRSSDDMPRASMPAWVENF
jgi:hypothetical protein